MSSGSPLSPHPALPRRRWGRSLTGGLMRAAARVRHGLRAVLSRAAGPDAAEASRLLVSLDQAADGLVLIGRDGRIVHASRRVPELLPAAAGLLVPGTPVERFALAAGLAPDAQETEVADPGGAWVRITRNPTADGGSVLTVSDITTQKRREAALEQTNARLDAALNNMPQGLCLYDSEHRLLIANRRFYEIYRLDPAVVRPGITFHELLARSIAAGNHNPTVAKTLIAERLGFVARRESGTSFQDLADGRVIAISHEPIPGGHWVVTYQDITERRRAEAQITYLARHDALTGLANRLQLRERVD